MAPLGRVCLLLALAVCAYGIGAAVYGVRRGRPEFSDSARRAMYCLAGVLTVAFALLELAFLREDFTFNTVADTSSRTTPALYRAAAMWSSQEGSLLLWAWLLSLWSSLALFLLRHRMREVASYATAILLGLAGFFVSLMIFYASPFATTHPAPAEGAGLDPLLRFPTMVIHPPMLYSGYTLCTIPLALGAGALAVMGTFLVRSGILNSIHAFGGATLGVPFVTLIGVLVAGSIYLVVSRRQLLRSQHRLEALLSREAIFLANNLVLVGLCFVIFWGTYFPLISEAFTGREASVGPPWFDRYTVPLALLLVLLSGVGPVIAWRRATFANARRNFLAPLLLGLVTPAVLLAAGVQSKPAALALFGCAAFVLAAVAQEFIRGALARRAMAGEQLPSALVNLVRRNRRRYGGYVVHAGIAVLFIGVAASSSFQHASELALGVGQSTRVGAYTMHYQRPTATVTPASDSAHTGSTLNLGAVVEVTKHGHHVATLRPSAGYYDSGQMSQGTVGHLIGGQTVSHISMTSSVTRDVWTAISPNISSPYLQRIV